MIKKEIGHPAERQVLTAIKALCAAVNTNPGTPSAERSDALATIAEWRGQLPTTPDAEMHSSNCNVSVKN